MEQRLAIFADELRKKAASLKSLSHHSTVLDATRNVLVEVIVAKTPTNALKKPGNIIWISPDKVYRRTSTNEMVEIIYYGDMFAHFKSIQENTK